MELSARGDAEPSLDLGKAMLQQRLLRVRARSSGVFDRYLHTLQGGNNRFFEAPSAQSHHMSI